MKTLKELGLTVEEAFTKFEDDFLKFEGIENKLSTSNDLCGILKLQTLVPPEKKAVLCAAKHDTVYLWPDIDQLLPVATLEDIEYLVRCGIVYDSENDCLFIFV